MESAVRFEIVRWDNNRQLNGIIGNQLRNRLQLGGSVFEINQSEAGYDSNTTRLKKIADGLKVAVRGINSSDRMLQGIDGFTLPIEDDLGPSQLFTLTTQGNQPPGTENTVFKRVNTTLENLGSPIRLPNEGQHVIFELPQSEET